MVLRHGFRIRHFPFELSRNPVERAITITLRFFLTPGHYNYNFKILFMIFRVSNRAHSFAFEMYGNCVAVFRGLEH